MENIHNLNNFKSALRLIRIPTHDVNDNFHIFSIADVQEKEKNIHTPFFRQFFFDITFFQTIKFQWNYASNSYDIGDDTLQVVPPRQIQQVVAPKESLGDFKGYTLYFQPGYLSLGYDNKKFLQDFPFFLYGNMNVLVNMTKKDIQKILGLIKQIHYIYLEKAKYYHQVINGLLWSLLHTIKEAWETQYDKQDFAPSDLITRLESEIQTQFDFGLKVSDYADMLHISPKYLSQKLKKETGQSAKDIIDANFVLEAKALLKATDMPVAQIAYQLGYSEPSAFSRFFKRASGQTPEQFRKNLPSRQ